MRKIAISIVLTLIALGLPLAVPAATAATGDTLTATTPVNVTDGGAKSFMTASASADGSKIIGAVNGGKAYRSVDYGRTWSELTGLTSVIASSTWNASASSADGSVLYIGAFGGFVYRSQDSGATWTQIGASRNWYQLATSSDGHILFGAAGTAFLYRSTDYGTTITATATAFAQDNVACSTDGQIVYVAESGHPIYKSTDAGTTFTSTGSATTDWRWIATDNTGTRIVAAAWNAGYLYVSTDSAATFATATAAGSRQWTALSVSGDGTKMLAGVRGGVVMKSLNSGSTWTSVNGNTTVYSYASDISNDGTRFYMTAGSSITLRSNDSGATFSSPGVLQKRVAGYVQQTIHWSADGTKAAVLICVPGGDCLLATSNDGGQNFMLNLALGQIADGSSLAMASNGNNIIVNDSVTHNFIVSSNFGSTWSTTTNPSGTTASWVTMALSADGSKIIAGEDNGKLLYSSNSGASFTVSNSTTARWLAPSINADGSVMLVNKYPNGIFRSTDNGATWTNVQVQGSGDLQWTAISANGNTAAATNWAGKVWLSHDKGATWTTTSTSSTSNYNTVSISANGEVIFASSFDNNIDYSLDSGATWSKLNSATISQVDAVAISGDARKLMYITGTASSFQTELFVADLTITTASLRAEEFGPRVYKIDNRTPSPVGGDLITLTGKNFDTVDTLKVDGKLTDIKSQTYSTLTFLAPAHAVGLVQIYLASPDGILTFVNAFTYTAPKKVAAKMPTIPTTLKVKNSVTLTPIDSTLVPKLSTTTPKVCAVTGLKVTAKKAGSCALKVSINVDQNDWFTKSNTGYYAIQITN